MAESKEEREARERREQEAKQAQQQAKEEEKAGERRAKLTRDEANAYDRVGGKLENSAGNVDRLIALVQEGMLTEAELATIETALPKIEGKERDEINAKAADSGKRTVEIQQPRQEQRAAQERVLAQLNKIKEEASQYNDKARAVKLGRDEFDKAEEMADKIEFLAVHRPRGG